MTTQISRTLSLLLCPYHLSLPAGLQNYIQCPHRADVKKALASQPILIRPFIGAHRRMLLMSLSFLLYQFPACLVNLFGWFLRWEVCDCVAVILWCCFQDYFKTACGIIE